MKQLDKVPMAIFLIAISISTYILLFKVVSHNCGIDNSYVTATSKGRESVFSDLHTLYKIPIRQTVKLLSKYILRL